VIKATHKLDGNGGYLTSLELENRATASDGISAEGSNDEIGSAAMYADKN
jgi:hypothetical protein